MSKLNYVWFFFRKARYHRVRFSGYAPDAAFPDYHWRCDGQMFQIHLLEVLLRSLPTAQTESPRRPTSPEGKVIPELSDNVKSK